jgi:hypothetical protein
MKQHSKQIHTNIKDTLSIPTDGVAVDTTFQYAIFQKYQKQFHTEKQAVCNSASNHLHTQ